MTIQPASGMFTMDGARHKTAESEASVSQVFSPVELAVLHMARHDSVRACACRAGGIGSSRSYSA